MTTLRGGVIALVLLVTLLMVPASASAVNVVWTQPFSANPCTPGSGLASTFPTPLGSFSGRYCKHAVKVGNTLLPAFSNFAWQLAPTPVGVINVSGNVVCLTVIGHTAWERDLIVTSNSPLLPAGVGLIVETVDGNFPPETQAPPPNGDGIIAFATPPPGPNPTCPSTPFATNPVTSGGVIVF